MIDPQFDSQNFCMIWGYNIAHVVEQNKIDWKNALNDVKYWNGTVQVCADLFHENNQNLLHENNRPSSQVDNKNMKLMHSDCMNIKLKRRV